MDDDATRKVERCKILEEAKSIIMERREEKYGSPHYNFKNIAAFWSIYIDKELTSKDVAIMMALLKISRIKTGTKIDYIDDNFIDLAGYSALAAELQKDEISRKGKELRRNE